MNYLKKSNSFTSVSVGDVFTLQPNESVDYAVSGTFSASLNLTVSDDTPNGPWPVRQTITGATSGTLTNETKSTQYVRFNCTAYTSGTAVATLTTSETNEKSFRDVRDTNGNLFVRISPTKATFSRLIKNDVTDHSINFASFEDAATAGYFYGKWSALEESSSVRFALVGYQDYTGQADITGTGHFGGVLGIGEVNSAQYSPLVIGVEGRGGVKLAGSTAGIVCGLLGTLNTNTEDGGTALVGAQLYLPPYTDNGHYSTTYSILANNQNDNYLQGRVRMGMGTSTGQSTAVGKAEVNTTAVGNVGTGEDDLMSYTLPANAMSAAGKGVRITAWGYVANNANAKTLKLYFGSTAIATASLTINQVGIWRAEGIVLSTGEDAQHYTSEIKETGGAADTFGTGNPTEDDGATITIKVTGEGVSDSDIIQTGFLVEFLN